MCAVVRSACVENKKRPFRFVLGARCGADWRRLCAMSHWPHARRPIMAAIAARTSTGQI